MVLVVVYLVVPVVVYLVVLVVIYLVVLVVVYLKLLVVVYLVVSVVVCIRLRLVCLEWRVPGLHRLAGAKSNSSRTTHYGQGFARAGP